MAAQPVHSLAAPGSEVCLEPVAPSDTLLMLPCQCGHPERSVGDDLPKIFGLKISRYFKQCVVPLPFSNL